VRQPGPGSGVAHDLIEPVGIQVLTAPRFLQHHEHGRWIGDCGAFEFEVAGQAAEEPGRDRDQVLMAALALVDAPDVEATSLVRIQAGALKKYSLTLAAITLLAVAGCGIGGDETFGELVAFEMLKGVKPAAAAAELAPGQEPRDVLAGLGRSSGTALPRDMDGVRRFVFVDIGCREDSAQLVLEDGVLDAQLLEDGSTEQRTMCAAPVYFLTVFDVPSADLPDGVRLR